MSFAEHLAADRRRAILKSLIDLDGHANESVMTDLLRMIGHVRTTRETVRTDFEWLQERGLISTEFVMESVNVAHITARGIDAAAGRITVDGLKRPEIVG